MTARGLPLAERRIVVTRARHQAEPFASRLRALGAAVIVFPTIELAPPDGTGALDAAIDTIMTFDWIVFASANGVRYFLERVESRGIGLEMLRGRRVAAIGPATSDSLRALGLVPDLVPDRYVAEELAAAMGDVGGQRILIPAADDARPALAERLSSNGADVIQVVVYRTVPGRPHPAAYDELRTGVDVLTFTSPSTLQNYIVLAGELATVTIQKALIVCIGTVTASAAREHGVRVDLVAPEHTVDVLIRILVDYYAAPEEAIAGVAQR